MARCLGHHLQKHFCFLLCRRTVFRMKGRPPEKIREIGVQLSGIPMGLEILHNSVTPWKQWGLLQSYSWVAGSPRSCPRRIPAPSCAQFCITKWCLRDECPKGMLWNIPAVRLCKYSPRRPDHSHPGGWWWSTAFNGALQHSLGPTEVLFVIHRDPDIC